VHKALPGVVVGLVTLFFAYACVAFVRQPGLGTFADDSVSYLILAQGLSPWHAVSEAVREALPREAFYPPLFPLVLALTGASHDFATAHVVNALLLAACLPLAYLLGKQWLQSDWAAATATLATALLPAMWINARGILSEPLYCLLLLGTLYAIENQRRPWAIALMMSCMVLTRASGLVVALAYGLWAASRHGLTLRSRVHAALPAIIAVLAYGLWTFVRPAETADDYARIVLERAHGLLSPATLGANLARQANAVAEGWIGSLLLFWVEGQPVRVLLAAAVGLFVLVGMAMRMRSGKADSWMMAGYLATFLVWPFYDQMGRFLFPALPVFLLYAFFAAGALMGRAGRPPAAAHALVGLLLVSLCLPALAFIRQRAVAPGPQTQIIDWYRTPDLAAAQARAKVHLDLMHDMDTIRQFTPEGARVTWVAPSYIALLADRRGVRSPDPGLAPFEYKKAIEASGAEYVFLSTYHPRDTIRDTAWRAGTAALRESMPVIHKRAGPAGMPVSLLLQVRP
jgi:hypothetical protein